MEAELFRVSLSTAITAENIGGEISAHWDEVGWKDLILIGDELATLTSKITNINRDLISDRRLIGIPVDGLSQVSISYVTTHQKNSAEFNNLNDGIMMFVKSVLGENRSGDLFSSERVSVDLKRLVLQHASCLIEKVGGKKIASPFVVEGGLIREARFCDGSYSRKPPPDPLADTGKKSHVGEVVALSRRENWFELILSSRDIAKFYFSHDHFFSELRNILGDGSIRTFVTHDQARVNKPPIPVLVGIEEFL